MQRVWDDLGKVKFRKGQWEEKLCRLCRERYGVVNQRWVEKKDKANTKLPKSDEVSRNATSSFSWDNWS